MRIKKWFGQNVAYMTREYGQKTQLADAAELTTQQLNNIINGTGVKGCGLETAFAIAAALGSSLDEMCLPPRKFKKLQEDKATESAA